MAGSTSDCGRRLGVLQKLYSDYLLKQLGSGRCRSIFLVCGGECLLHFPRTGVRIQARYIQ